jgi:hypothetical protein
MSIDLEKLGVAMRLSELQEHLAKEQTAMQEAADRMRDIVDAPAMRKVREMQERLMAVADPPYMRQMREMFDSTHVKTLADMVAGMKPLVDPALFSGSISQKLFDDWKLIGAPVDHFAGLKALMPAESLSAAIAKSFAADAATINALTHTSEVFRAFQVPDYAKEFKALTGMSIETEKMMATLDVGRGFADLLAVHDVTRSMVEYETSRLNRAYAGFGASILNRPDWLASAPDFVRTMPGEIVFAQARFVRTVTTHEDVENESAVEEIWGDVQTHTLGYIEAVLPELNPRLMKSWEGAWDAARRRGPDWARQAASSLRFLLIEALETVAPMDEVKKSKVPTQYIKNGQILRLGQIHWLCEPLQNRTYVKVVRADLDSAMTIIDAMNEAVHREDYEEIEDAFRTMAVRSALALCNLLKLWKTRH